MTTQARLERCSACDAPAAVTIVLDAEPSGEEAARPMVCKHCGHTDSWPYDKGRDAVLSIMNAYAFDCLGDIDAPADAARRLIAWVESTPQQTVARALQLAKELATEPAA